MSTDQPDRVDVNMPRGELARVTLAVLFIAGLIVGSLWILSPFVAAFIWATMIVVATWPIMIRAQRTLWDKRGLAVAAMTLLLLVVFILPIGLAVSAILAHVGDVSALVAGFSGAALPPPPHWLDGVPLVGERLAARWDEATTITSGELTTRIEPYARSIAAWVAQSAGSFAIVVLQFVLIVVLAAVLYSGGESWASWLKRFGRKLAGDQGEQAVVLAGRAIRSVALGVIVTALAQSLLAGIGLAISGIPFASVLTAIIFILCIAQLGPILILLPASGWLFLSGSAGWGIFLLVWALIVGPLDQILRPALIRRGADLPMLLIFAGVVGGLATFGVLGIFVGPVVLAVAYTLIDEWVRTEPAGPDVRSQNLSNARPG